MVFLNCTSQVLPCSMEFYSFWTHRRRISPPRIRSFFESNCNQLTRFLNSLWRTSRMAHASDVVSMRALRLNNVIQGKCIPNFTLTHHQLIIANNGVKRRSENRKLWQFLYVFRLGDGRNIMGISAEFSSSMTKDCLLDAFYVLYRHCSSEKKRNHSKILTDFVNKCKWIWIELIFE